MPERAGLPRARVSWPELTQAREEQSTKHGFPGLPSTYEICQSSCQRLGTVVDMPQSSSDPVRCKCHAAATEAQVAVFDGSKVGFSQVPRGALLYTGASCPGAGRGKLLTSCRPRAAQAAAPSMAAARPSKPAAGEGIQPSAVATSVCSPEARQVCETHLKLLASAFSHLGALVASAHVRVPASLKTGALELQCVALVGGEPRSDNSAILIGGPDSSLTEEHMTAQPALALPSHGHLVLPLTYSSFLVCTPSGLACGQSEHSYCVALSRGGGARCVVGLFLYVASQGGGVRMRTSCAGWLACARRLCVERRAEWQQQRLAGDVLERWGCRLRRPSTHTTTPPRGCSRDGRRRRPS